MNKTPKGFRPMPEEMTEPDSNTPGVDSGLEEVVPADTGHLDAIKVDEMEGIMPEPDGAPQPSPVISREDFHAMFCGVFGMAHAVTRLQSLRVDREGPTVRPCTGAIYDIAEETPSLRWLIEPGGVWMQRAFAIGAFAVPMGLGVSAELKARSAAKKAAARHGNDNTPHAANDNGGGAELVGVPVG